MSVVIYAKILQFHSDNLRTKILNHSFDLPSANENLETCMQVWFK